jgi:hypothetical protein
MLTLLSAAVGDYDRYHEVTPHCSGSGPWTTVREGEKKESEWEFHTSPIATHVI